jgi:bifunctional UDP-N-acetylglucosamine pyrophosphorylase / glucosamine-1-phosphate N-acetyltransferase
MTNVTAVILAAGEGKRMKSNRPKVLHDICGRTLLGHVLHAADSICGQAIVVVGHGAARVKQALGNSVTFVLQEEQLGTGHAVMQAVPELGVEGDVLVLCGDTPLLSAETLQKLYHAHHSSGAAATVLTAVVPNPYGYGRIVRSADCAVVKIVEEKDATAEERQICEINTGTYIFKKGALLESLNNLNNNNTQGEYYLTDCIALVIRQGLDVASFCMEDYRDALGVNDRAQLAEAGRLMQERINNKWMQAGVTMIDPRVTYIDADVEIGPDTTIYPNTILRGRGTVGSGSVIGPNTEITGCIIGNNVSVRHSVLSDCVLEDDVTVGPFAHLRPETVLRRGAKIGDFVEIKKSDVGPGTKIPHLSYVGDAQVGRGVNLGAGTIVVNYDGRKKHRTEIGDGAFVGCNSNLVAPLRIGKGAFVAAGSTITRDVPDGSLSLARPRQVNKDSLAARFLDVPDDGDS